MGLKLCNIAFAAKLTQFVLNVVKMFRLKCFSHQRKKKRKKKKERQPEASRTLGNDEMHVNVQFTLLN